MAKCKGKSMWSYLTKTDDKYTPCWRTDLIVDEAEAKKLIALGLKKLVKKIDPLTDPDVAAMGDYRIKFTRYRDRRGKFAGQQNKQPTLVDADNEPFEGILGNGSDVIVKFNVFTWNNKFGTGTGADLDGVKVINLVPYESVDVDDEGVTVEKDTDDDDKW